MSTLINTIKEHREEMMQRLEEIHTRLIKVEITQENTVVPRTQALAEGVSAIICKNSGNEITDHFGDVTEMVSIGSGAKRPFPS